jgi:hypothetical protein
MTVLDSNILAVNYIGLTNVEETVEYHFRGTLNIDQKLTDQLSLTFIAFQDPMLQRRILGRVNFTYKWLNLQAGPFLGIVNTPGTIINPGISVIFGVNNPRIAFSSVKVETTILSSIDGYSQNGTEFKIGLGWVPVVVPSFSVDIIYTERREKGYTIGRKQSRYSISLDTVDPEGTDKYTINLNMGYQELGWSVYHPDQVAVAYQLNSIYASLYGSYRVMPNLKIIAGGLIPIYSWITTEGVQKSFPIPKNPLFFDLTIGIIWTWDFMPK